MLENLIFSVNKIIALVTSNCDVLREGLCLTLEITLTAIVIGLVMGTVLALARISPVPAFRFISKIYINVFRSIPLVMVLLWFYLIVPQFLTEVLGLSPKTDIRLTSAIVAFSLFEAAYYSEIIRAGIRAVSKGQSNAALALGMTRGQSYRLVILPQAFRVMTPLLLTQCIILFQDTSVVYMLSLADFFRRSLLIGNNTGFAVEMVVFAGFVYFIICFVVSLMVTYFKKRISVS